VKILVIVSEFPKVTETFVYRNIAEYRRRGHDAIVFYAKRFLPDEIVHEFARDTVRSAFTFGFFDRRAVGAMCRETLAHPGRQVALAAELLREHRKEPMRGAKAFAVVPKATALAAWCRENGIEHIHAEFAGFPATVAMLAARSSGIPFSFSAHANDIFVSQSLLLTKAREARFVRAISRYNIDFLTKIPGFPAEKLQLIHCGIDRALLDAEPPASPGSGPLNILYVGSLIRKKGVGDLIEALALLRDQLPFRCRIVGKGDLEASLKAAASAHGLEDVVEFCGPKDSEGVREAYRWAHVVVVPSTVGQGGRIEGIPVVAMEAMAHARPVVASRLSGIPELIEDNGTGWLTPPGDPSAIAAAVHEIYGNWDAAAVLARRGRERVREEYLIDENAAALLRAMEETT